MSSLVENNNTVIELKYVDGDNFKKFKEVVLSGKITDRQIVAIRGDLDEGSGLIANQVGLPTPSEEFSEKYVFPNEQDHVWSTLEAFESHTPCVDDLLTSKEPTIAMSITDLVEAILAVTWDETIEMERLGMI